MKAFTFLGKGVLHKSTYVFDGMECETQFFAEAIVKFFSPKSLYFFTTESAAKEPVSNDNKCGRLKFLTELLGNKTEIVPIRIEEGADEEELWKIFDTVVGEIKDNDKVLFDITHGFRSLPFLTFLALAYVRNVRNGVEIKRVIYGAFDAVDRNNPRKPVFDLTPFVSLLDWMNAVNIFQLTGDARQIAKLRESSPIENSTQISETLTNLSDALLMNLPIEAQKAAFTFNNLNLEQQKPSQAPFGMLIGELKKTYKGMGIEKPYENPKDSLNAQYKQIEWYIKNRHYFQATTLIREWLVSWECQRAEPNNPDWLNENRRNNANKRLNEYTKNYFGQLAKNLSKHSLHASSEEFRRDCECVQNERDEKFIEIDLHLTSTKLWEDCKIIRNRLAHCGMTKRSGDEATQTFKEISEEVERLSQEIKRLQEIYKKFMEAKDGKDPKDISSMQREQIEWYISKNHHLCAITVIREWLIYWKCHHNPSQALERNCAIQELQNRKKPLTLSSTNFWYNCQKIKEQLSKLEKEFRICDAKETIEEIQEVYNRLKNLAFL